MANPAQSQATRHSFDAFPILTLINLANPNPSGKQFVKVKRWIKLFLFYCFLNEHNETSEAKLQIVFMFYLKDFFSGRSPCLWGLYGFSWVLRRFSSWKGLFFRNVQFYYWFWSAAQKHSLMVQKGCGMYYNKWWLVTRILALFIGTHYKGINPKPFSCWHLHIMRELYVIVLSRV